MRGQDALDIVHISVASGNTCHAKHHPMVIWTVMFNLCHFTLVISFDATKLILMERSLTILLVILTWLQLTRTVDLLLTASVASCNRIFQLELCHLSLSYRLGHCDRRPRTICGNLLLSNGSFVGCCCLLSRIFVLQNPKTLNFETTYFLIRNLFGFKLLARSVFRI